VSDIHDIAADPALPPAGKVAAQQGPTASRPGRLRARQLTLATAALLIVGGLASFGWWWTHPTLFGPPGNAAGLTGNAVGVPANASLTFPGAPNGVEDVTIEHITANVAKNTSASTITFSVCTEDPTYGVVGANRGRLTRVCAAVRPATEVRLGPDDYILVTATATKVGVLDMPSFNFTYRYGPGRLFQHGTEQTGIRITVRTTR